jgi:hypothetical protein
MDDVDGGRWAMSLNCMVVQRQWWKRNHKMIGSGKQTEKSVDQREMSQPTKSNITDQEKSKYCKVTRGRNHLEIMH